MSALVVNAVSDVATGQAVTWMPTPAEEEDSAITPFKTVLKETTDKVKKQSSDSVATKAVNDAEKKPTSSTGKTKLANIFKKASEKYNISYDFLVAVAKAESDFNYKCVSSAGAKGIMQLMPDEVKEFKVKDVYNPEENIMAAAKLLAAHLKKFNGNYTLAAAAYNAGSGAVKKYGGVPPYSETQNYVKKINKYMKEGVKVPNKDAEVSGEYSAYENGTASTSAVKKASTDSVSATSENEEFDTGVMATDEDWDKVRVTVGTGEKAVTMTYGAYQKYKELGSLGVG